MERDGGKQVGTAASARSPAVALPGLGERVGPYQLTGILGQGAMGIVYAARDSTGAAVALKLSRDGEPRLAALMRREVSALARLDHPRIIKVIDRGEHHGRPWYAMPFLVGRSLRTCYVDAAAAPTLPTEVGADPEAVSDGAPPGRPNDSFETRKPLLRLLAELCEPLAFCHGEGAVHRDLKPENVLVCEGGPVLVDFGLAHRFDGDGHRDHLDADAFASGTRAYAAPEQLAGEPVDARADIYALAVMCYEAMCGERPRRGAGAEPLWFPGDCPERLRRILEQSLAFDRTRRPGFMGSIHEAFRACGLADAPLRVPPRAHVLRPALAGRERERTALASRVARLPGEGGLVLLEGRSGSGKTRLAAEALRAARARRIPRVGVECAPPPGGTDEGTEGAPLSALLPALRRVHAALEVAQRTTWDERFGELMAPFGLSREAAPATPTGAHHRPADMPTLLANAALALMRTLAAEHGLVLVVDDVQWADELSLEVLGRLGSALPQTSVLVLALARLEATRSGLRETLDRWASGHGTERIVLPSLGADSIATVVAEMLGSTKVPAALVRGIVERADGSPLFAAESVRSAVAERLVIRDHLGRWRVAPGEGVDEALVARLPLPDHIDALLSQRLRQCSPAAQRVASLLATWGRSCEERLLEETVDRLSAPDERPAVGGAIDELVRHEVVGVQPDGALRFRHDRLRETAYAALSAERRRKAHEAVARVLEAHPENTGEERAGLLASHWIRAGDPGRAAAFALAAGRGAVRRQVPAEAKRLFRWFLDHCGEAPVAFDPETVFEARSRYLRACLESGQDMESLPPMLALLQSEAEELDHPRARGVAGTLEAEYLSRVGRQQESGACAAAAAEHSRAAGDDEVELRARFVEAVSLYHANEYARAIAVYDALLAREEPPLPRAEEAMIRSALGLALREAGRLADARGQLEDSLALQGGEPTTTRGVTLNHLAGTLLYAGELDAAKDRFIEALEVLRTVGAAALEGYALHDLAETYLYAGRPSEAAACYAESRVLFERSGNRQLLFMADAGRVLAWVDLGRIDEARRSIETIVAQAGGPEPATGVVWLALARLRLAESDEGSALEALEGVRPGCQVFSEASVLDAYVRGRRGGAGRARAITVLTELLAESKPIRRWESAFARVRLATLLRLDDGVGAARRGALLDRAEGDLSAMGNRLWLARVDIERSYDAPKRGTVRQLLERAGAALDALEIGPESPHRGALERAARALRGRV